MERLLLRVAEAAEIAGISRSLAYRLVQDGTWPSVRVGSSIRVPVAALKKWIEERISVYAVRDA